MKKILLAAAALLALICCTSNPTPHPKWTYDSVVYELNVRQYSPEGTFAAAEAQLPRLKELGVDIIWLMPIYRIGVEGRKGTLGSYYAIADYCSINPEFGTMEDFEHFLAAAHKMGFKVILDWVANQTAPDNVWMTEKPADFYERDSLGNAIWEYDWTDTRSLNYECKGVWEAQDEAMRFWLRKGVDGFRCDAAGDVPAEFWYGILPKMNEEYPDIYLLAEAERPELADPAVTFDANYAWELHHMLNGLAQGSRNVQELKDYVARDAERFPKEAYRLMFTSNHDENSWAGTEFEREGAAAEACAVLCFTLPNGQPLIYTGQEIGLSRRLEFFEKDPITDWSDNEHTEFYKKLVEMKHRLHVLDAGEKGGPIEWIDAPDGVIAFSREGSGNKIVVVVNFGTAAVDTAELEQTEANDNRPAGAKLKEPFQNLQADPVDVTLELDGTYRDQFDGSFYKGTVTLPVAPGEYYVLAR